MTKVNVDVWRLYTVGQVLPGGWELSTAGHCGNTQLYLSRAGFNLRVGSFSEAAFIFTKSGKLITVSCKMTFKHLGGNISAHENTSKKHSHQQLSQKLLKKQLFSAGYMCWIHSWGNHILELTPTCACNQTRHYEQYSLLSLTGPDGHWAAVWNTKLREETDTDTPCMIKL